jgi:hypothetical protein
MDAPLQPKKWMCFHQKALAFGSLRRSPSPPLCTMCGVSAHAHQDNTNSQRQCLIHRMIARRAIPAPSLSIVDALPFAISDPKVSVQNELHLSIHLKQVQAHYWTMRNAERLAAI